MLVRINHKSINLSYFGHALIGQGQEYNKLESSKTTRQPFFELQKLSNFDPSKQKFWICIRIYYILELVEISGEGVSFQK